MPNSTLDATVDKLSDQAFAKSQAVGLHAQDRMSAGNDFVAELTRQTFLAEVSKVGTREAAAMQRMDTDKLSEKILDARAVRDQPGSSPFSNPSTGK